MKITNNEFIFAMMILTKNLYTKGFSHYDINVIIKQIKKSMEIAEESLPEKLTEIIGIFITDLNLDKPEVDNPAKKYTEGIWGLIEKFRSEDEDNS